VFSYSWGVIASRDNNNIEFREIYTHTYAGMSVEGIVCLWGCERNI
jgi:hypothetical protein